MALSDSNKGISGSASILVIGGVNIDIYGRADDAERATFSLADSYPGTVHIHAGGVARNIAENLGRLGLKAGFIGCFGQDEYTGLLTASLQDANVDISLSKQSAIANDIYLGLFAADGQMIYAVNQMRCVTEIDIAFLSRHLAVLQQAKTLVVDGNLDTKALYYIAEHKGNALLAADMVSTSKAIRFAGILPAIDIVKCTAAEAASLTDLPEDAPPDALCDALQDKGIGTILLSLGAEGFILANRAQDRLWIKPAQTGEISNSSGAGDGLLAGYIYGIETGMDSCKAGYFARDLAALSLASEGAVNPDIKKLLDI